MSKSFIAMSVIALLLFVALVLLFQPPPRAPGGPPEISYSEFLALGSKVRDVVIRGDVLTGHDTEGHAFTAMVPHDPALPTRLAQAGTQVTIGTAPTDNSNWIVTLFINLVPLVIFYLVFALPLRRLAKAVEVLAERSAPAPANPQET